jgi:very-short-patch-repair endonuclease
MPRRADPDPPLPTAFNAQQALAAGLTRDQIRQRVRNGKWICVGRGHYLLASVIERPHLDAHARERVLHAGRAAAAARRHPGSVIAFESAAVIHQLPLWQPLANQVSLLVGPDRWTGRQGSTVLRFAHLPDGHVEMGNPPITTPARTWLDVARTSTLAQALAVGDAGLRTRLFDEKALDRVLDEARALRGLPRAVVARAHVDGRRESPLESASWAYFVEHDIPLPTAQRVIIDGLKRFVARVDFWWDDVRLVGECDGRAKYLTVQDVYAEKLREDRIRALGYSVIRWGARELAGTALATRLRGLLDPRPALDVARRGAL